MKQVLKKDLDHEKSLYILLGINKDLLHNERRIKQKVNELISNIRKKFSNLFGNGKNIQYTSSGLQGKDKKGAIRQFD